MYRPLIAMLGLLVAQDAAAGVVVWLEPDLPEQRYMDRADNKTGGTEHVDATWLAFPPDPASEDDDVAYDALRDTVSEGERIWTEFEVEYGIAQELDESLDQIDVIRDDRDREEVVDALLFQGAAAHIAFEPDEWITSDRAEPFRIDAVGRALNRPWLEAMALNPERQYNRGDVADGASFPALQTAVEDFSYMAPGFVSVPPLDDNEQLFVNGVPAESTDELKLFPGRHYAHLVRDGEIAGRMSFRVEEGQNLELPVLVDSEERNQARNQVLQETTTGFPEDVKTALNAIARDAQDEIFVGAVDDGKMVVLPYAAGAELLKQKPVTVLAAGELGGGVVISSIFDQAEGDLLTAPGPSGSLSLEVGIYNGVILGGLDVVFTPARTITHADAAEEENVDTSVLAQPWGGVGAYILRPTGTTPSLLVAGTYGWDAPAHMAFGGRISLGVPIDAQGTFFRSTIGGKAGPKSMWDEGDSTPMYSGFLRFGLAGLF